MRKQSKRPMTTIRVCPRNWKHIESHSVVGESVNSTIRRILKLGGNGVKPVPKPQSPMKLIKIARDVMNLLVKNAKPRESRDQTLGRLFGIVNDDGNVRAK